MLFFRPPSWSLHEPRAWQVEALEAIARHYAVEGADPGVVSAIMGAGKSLLIAEICATVHLDRDEVVVVSTSTQLLVEQLRHDIQQRCGFDRDVGTWYGQRKRLGAIIIACVPSVSALAEKLRRSGKVVRLWLADECHRSECSTVLEAQEALAPGDALGVTATAYRSKGTESISLFEHILYRYGVARAQQDGVVVPWRIVHWPGGGSDDVDEVCLSMASSAEGPGLANAKDIADAEEFSAALCAAGIPSAAVHSKHKARTRNDTMRRLRDGELGCVVHCDLLTEGANYPWLRWLLLRRRVGARVRFVQEVGRLLRSSPGKDLATFYDPHDLFAEFRLSYEEALGEPPEKREINLDILAVGERIEKSDSPPEALTWIESTIRALVVAADAHEMLSPRRKMTREQRQGPVDELQRVLLERLSNHTKDYVPIPWRRCIEATVDRSEHLPFGAAADLIAVLDGVLRHRRWPPVDTQLRVGGASC